MYRGHEGVHLWLSQFGEHLEHLDIRVQKAVVDGDCGAVLGIVFDTGENRNSPSRSRGATRWRAICCAGAAPTTPGRKLWRRRG
jgi:hypothetical protein